MFLYGCRRSIRRTGRGLAAMQVLLSLQLLLAVTKAPAMVKAITDAGDIAALVQVRVISSFFRGNNSDLLYCFFY